MAHYVEFSVPSRDLGRADIEFAVWRDDTKLGTLAVSKGSVVWFPRDHSWGYKIGWAKFDEVMAGNGTRWERR